MVQLWLSSLFTYHCSALDAFKINFGFINIFSFQGFRDGYYWGTVFKAIIQGLKPPTGIHQPALFVSFVWVEFAWDKQCVGIMFQLWFSFRLHLVWIIHSLFGASGMVIIEGWFAKLLIRGWSHHKGYISQLCFFMLCVMAFDKNSNV